MPLCLACGREFAQHFIVEAHAVSRWRGKSFDADAVLGLMGLEMMDALGLSPRRPGEFEAFRERVHVKLVRTADPEAVDVDPSQGERQEFHVGTVGALDPREIEALRQAALRGLSRSAKYRGGRLVEA